MNFVLICASAVLTSATYPMLQHQVTKRLCTLLLKDQFGNNMKHKKLGKSKYVIEQRTWKSKKKDVEEGPRGGGSISNPKIYIADFGPLNRAFSA